MSTFLSLLGVVAFIACTIAVAAAITWAVVKVSPTKGRRDDAQSGSQT